MNDPKENKNFNPKFKLIIVRMNIILELKLSLFLQSKDKDKKGIYKNFLAIILFLYIIIYNLKEPEKVTLFLKINSSSTLKLLKRVLKVFRDVDEKIDMHYIELSHFMLNFCFDDIKKKIYLYQNEELIQVYQDDVYSEFLQIYPASNERFHDEDKKYEKFLNNILELKLDNYIHNLKGEKSEIFCRNLIPILLSYNDFDFISFYTYIVNKHIEIIRKDYDNELTSLFRADDFTNDLIKNLIIIFGNDSFINSFYFALPKEYLSNKEIEFDLDSFENFLHNFLEKLIKTLPFIIRVLLKIIHNCVQDLTKTENNYNVIYTVLIFNFFISPITLDLYNISMVQYKSLRQLTRILRNIYFGKEFDVKDKLSYFNKKVKLFHNYINEKFNILFDGIDIEKDKNDINKKLNNILINTKDIKDKQITIDNIFLPSFCYQFYWENILNSVKGMNLIK
jgi:hypothetical protein